MKVLVVDDSKAMRSIIGRILKDFDFEIIQAEHGLDALEKLRSMGRPDLVLVDWNMPQMDGLELVEAIRQVPFFDSVRIMMITTESDIKQMAKALEAGADEYLLKPFDREAFLEKLILLGVEPVCL